VPDNQFKDTGFLDFPELVEQLVPLVQNHNVDTLELLEHGEDAFPVLIQVQG